MADDSLERITILLQAKDRDFARAMERNNKLVAKFAREAGQGTTAMARTIDSNLARAGASAMNFGRSFVTGLAVGAVTAIFAEVGGSIRGVIGNLADLQDAADRINMGTEDYQALKFGMKLAGVQADEFSKSMEKFTENLGDAARGSGSLEKTLSSNGIAVRDLAGNVRPTADVMREFADLIKRTPDEATRMSLLSDAFGKGGKAMMLAMADGGSGLDLMIQKAIEAGVVMEGSLISKAAALDDRFDVLSARVSTFFQSMIIGAVDAGDAFAGMMASMGAGGALDVAMAGLSPESILGSEATAVLRENAEILKESVQDIANVAAAYNQMVEQAGLTSDELRSVGEAFLEIGDYANADMFLNMADELENVTTDFQQGKISGIEFRDMLDSVLRQADSTVDSLGAIDGVSFDGLIARILGANSVIEAMADRAARALRSVWALANVGQAGPEPFARGRDGSGPVSPLAPQNSSRPRAAPNDPDFGIPDIPAGGGSGGGGGGSSASRLNDQQREAARLFEQTRTEAEKYAAELVELNELLADGYIDQDLYARGLDQIKEKYGEAGGAAEFFKDTSDDLNQAFLDMAIDGVDSFDAIAKSIKRAALEALLFGSGPLAEIFGGKSGGKGGGFLSGFANLFKGKRAAGGSVTAGGAYMVGERGPELYVPGASGAIVPHSKVSGSGGQGPLSVQIGFDPTIGSFTAMVRDEAGRVVAMATPQIVSQSVGAVVSMSKKTKSALS